MRRALCILLLAAALVQVGRVAVFMHDPARRDFVAVPSSWFAFYGTHSCYAPYIVGAAMARQRVANLYEMTAVEDRCVGPELVGEGFARSLACGGPEHTLAGGLELEPYEYPPPFLLLPAAGLSVDESFLGLRTAWFWIELALVVLGLVVVARWIGGAAGRGALCLAPAVLLSLPVLLTLQIGNFQIATFACAMLAMVAFERGRGRGWEPLGGVLLAFVSLSKLYPGIFVLVLALQRRWRAVAWTAAAAAALLGLSVAVFGSAPLHAFVTYQLPRIQSGEAFPWLEHLKRPESIMRFAAINFSPYGVVKKLGSLGVPGMTREAANLLLWVYTAVVVGLAVLVGRARAATREALATSWLALLSLASLRSPFAPNCYAGAGTLWLITLLLPSVSRRAAVVLGATFVLLALVISEGRGDFPDTRVALAFDTAQQLAVFAVNGWALWRTRTRVP